MRSHTDAVSSLGSRRPSPAPAERLAPLDQAILGMLLEDIDEDEISRLLGLGPAALDSRRRGMLATLGSITDLRASPVAR